MKTEIKKNDTQIIVSVEGRMDTLSSKEFEQDIQPLYEEKNPDIVIDCKDLQYISSSGLRLFMTLYKNVRSNKGKLVLKNMMPEVKEVFDITGFSNIFVIE